MLEMQTEEALETLSTLMIFQARKPNGDYHENMDADMFSKWLEEFLFPALKERNLQGILVLDNASYHQTPAPGSVIVDSMKRKKDATDILDAYQVPYRAGVAPRGDSMVQLQAILRTWLRANAVEKGIMVNEMRIESLCKEGGHLVLFTPPYHPELQPIEDLWRDVKQYVARQFAGTRTMPQLKDHVTAGFRKYGVKKSCKKYVDLAVKNQQRYIDEGVYAVVVDLTQFAENDEEAVGVGDAGDDGVSSDSDMDVK